MVTYILLGIIIFLLWRIMNTLMFMASPPPPVDVWATFHDFLDDNDDDDDDDDWKYKSI